ncbi:MAG: hypothetical protein ACLT76_00465 [Clostridium fessum]
MVILLAAIVMLATHAQTGLTAATIGVFIGAFRCRHPGAVRRSARLRH